MTYIIVLKVTKFAEDRRNGLAKTLRGAILPHPTPSPDGVKMISKQDDWHALKHTH